MTIFIMSEKDIDPAFSRTGSNLQPLRGGGVRTSLVCFDHVYEPKMLK